MKTPLLSFVETPTSSDLTWTVTPLACAFNPTFLIDIGLDVMTYDPSPPPHPLFPLVTLSGTLW